MVPNPFAPEATRITMYACLSSNVGAADESYTALFQADLETQAFILEGEPQYTIVQGQV